MTLVMTCDRCGEHIPEGGSGGRCRLAKMAGKELVVDLCGPCQAVVHTDLVGMIAQWAADPRLGIRAASMPRIPA